MLFWNRYLFYIHVLQVFIDLSQWAGNLKTTPPHAKALECYLYINLACLALNSSWKSAIFFLKIRKSFFFFVLKCKQKEHVYNLNRRWALSALKAQCFKICLVLSKYIKWSQEIVAQSPPESPNKILILN